MTNPALNLTWRALDAHRAALGACHLNELFAAEARSVLHTALRRPADASLTVDDHDVMREIVAVRERVLASAIKTGSASRSDRVEKYTRLLQIEHELGANARFGGSHALRRR